MSDFYGTLREQANEALDTLSSDDADDDAKDDAAKALGECAIDLVIDIAQSLDTISRHRFPEVSSD